MDILFNPNVAYVLLIFGFMIAVFALFTPGTGILEIGALFTLFLAFYSISHLLVNWWAVAFLVIGFFPFILAMRRRQERSIWPLLMASMVAFIIGSTFLFRGSDGNRVVDVWLVLLMSLIAVLFTWFLARKTIQAAQTQPSFDLDRLVGMTGRASSDISGQGTVYVNGEEWTAVSSTFIPAGSAVRILRRRGLLLEVEQMSTLPS